MVVNIESKSKAFLFDWKLSWKYFEKYMKQKEGVRGNAKVREQILAFVRRVLNDNKLRFITRADIPKVESVLKESAGENPFFQKASKLFVNFLNHYLE
ncbi:hypothetical protein HRbin19_01244 [bacterium HR19]|nr:hypothetical protein HRbin19_01244 [bacterium HR19]